MSTHDTPHPTDERLAGPGNPMDATRESVRANALETAQCNAIAAAYEVAAGWLLVAAEHWRNGDAAKGNDAAAVAAQHQEHAQELECQADAPDPYEGRRNVRAITPDEVLLRVSERLQHVLDSIAGLGSS